MGIVFVVFFDTCFLLKYLYRKFNISFCLKENYFKICNKINFWYLYNDLGSAMINQKYSSNNDWLLSIGKGKH